jgi:hypothetical protein
VSNRDVTGHHSIIIKTPQHRRGAGERKTVAKRAERVGVGKVTAKSQSKASRSTDFFADETKRTLRKHSHLSFSKISRFFSTFAAVCCDLVVTIGVPPLV